MDLQKIEQHRADQLAKKQAKAQKEAEQSRVAMLAQSTIRSGERVRKAIEASDAKTKKVEVVNQPKVEVTHTTDFKPLLGALSEVKAELAKLPKQIIIPKIEPIKSVSVDNLNDYTAKLDQLISAVEAIEVSPQVAVNAPEVQVDLSKLTKEIQTVTKAVQAIKFPSIPKSDTKVLEAAVKSVETSINSLSFPVPNYVLPYSQNGKATQVVLTSDGKVPVEATFEGTIETDTVFSDSSDVGKKALVDADRHVQVDVLTMPAVTVDPPVGGATEAAQDEQTALLTTIDADTGAIKTAVETLDNAISGSEMQVDVVAPLPAGTNNIGDVDVLSSALPTGASTSAKQDTIIGHLDGVETLLGTIDADTSALAGAVSGTEVQVDVLTMPTTTVQATNLDVRDLSAASDSVTVHGDVGALDQLDLTNTNPIAAAIVDGDGTQITSFGGGTQYSDGDANADPTGTVAMGTDGTNVFAVHTDTSGDVQVDVLSSALPTGAATAANQQTDALTDTELRASPVVVDLGANNDVTVTGNVAVTNAGLTELAAAINASSQMDVNIAAGNITGYSTSAKQDTVIGHLDGVETLLGTIDADTGGILTSVQTLDNAISGNEMQVDVVAALPAGDNNIGNVDVVTLPALPAGTNAIGKLAANSGVDIGDVDVTSAVTGTIDHGSNQDIDTAAEQITSTSFACKFGVTLRADSSNTGILYIGNSDVTVSGTAATDGIPLHPGDSLFLPVSNSNIPYAIASANNQKIYWIAA